MDDELPRAGLGLYVHVPFCVRACPYCDFDFEVRRPDTSAVRRLVQGYEAELRARSIEPGAALDTVYVGGGTPSALGSRGIASVAEFVSQWFDTSPVVEWTVELNPEHVDSQMVQALVASKVGRVSLGVQSLRREGLISLGRAHRPAAALDAVRTCVSAGLDVSCDVIVGWPGEPVGAGAEDALQLARAGANHLSAYSLTIEAGTPWVELIRRGRRSNPDESQQTAALEAVESALTAAGFEHYEVSSYARPDHRAVHNRRYWQGRDVLGLGPSATSSTHRPNEVVRFRATRGFEAWVTEPGQGVAERVDGDSAAAEALWLGLREREGVVLARFFRRFPCVDANWLDARIARQCALGNLIRPPGRVAVAPGRWLHQDTIAVDLLG